MDASFLECDMSIDASRDFSLKLQNRMTNCVDPDETARYERSHQDLHCLHRCLFWSAGLKGLTLQTSQIFTRLVTKKKERKETVYSMPLFVDYCCFDEYCLALYLILEEEAVYLVCFFFLWFALCAYSNIMNILPPKNENMPIQI